MPSPAYIERSCSPSSPHHPIARACWGVLLIAMPIWSGCVFSERPFPMRPDDFVPLSCDPGRPETVRAWLRESQAQLAALLPEHKPPPLLSEQMVGAGGETVDVLDHFELTGRDLRTLLGNFRGLAHSAQAIGSDDGDPAKLRPWPGFEDVLVPVAPGVELSARLGLARRHGAIVQADCIVLLPGLLGDNAIYRTRDLAAALLSRGHHVLAVELRGHGQTDARLPHVCYTFGVLETVDLMRVSEWLEAMPHVRRTGLIGFCWGGNLGLLAAWYDGWTAASRDGFNHSPQETDAARAAASERPQPAGPGATALEQWAATASGLSEFEACSSITPELAKRLPPIEPQRHFSAGVIAFSSVFAFEELVDEMDAPVSYLSDPILGTLQGTVRDRTEAKGHPEATTSLRKLIEFEFARSALNYAATDDAADEVSAGDVEGQHAAAQPLPYGRGSDGAASHGGVADGYRFLRFKPYRGMSDCDKLRYSRVPTLIVHAANDPLCPAQDVADLIARTPNPNVAAVILPGGGHVGFPPFARSYYFSLILNFFDPDHGAAACVADPIPGDEHRAPRE